MIEPALTAEEWKIVLPKPYIFSTGETREGDSEIMASRYEDYHADRAEVVIENRMHALAACALYGQPFGFTRTDVTKLRFLLTAFEPEDHVRDWLPELTDRIEALLPPESAT